MNKFRSALLSFVVPALLAACGNEFDPTAASAPSASDPSAEGPGTPPIATSRFNDVEDPDARQLLLQIFAADGASTGTSGIAAGPKP